MGTSIIGPVAQSISLRSHVEQALSAAIVSGELAPGSLLTVPTLAAKFDVSATPVREAMIDLQRRGFVEPSRNRGFRVTEMSTSLLQELTEVRKLLEPTAMEKLALSFPSAQLATFESLAAEISAGASSGDLRAYLEADLKFHIGLTKLLDNSVLVQTIIDLRSRTRLLGLASMIDTHRLHESAAEHGELLSYLSARDATGAGELMRRHIDHTTGWWSGNLEEDRP